MMEQRGSELNKIFGTLHYPDRSGGNADGSTMIIDSASTAFHARAAIKISVDGHEFHNVANSAGIPFNHDFFLIMNVAIGGGSAGNVDPAFTSDSPEVGYTSVYK